MKEQERHMLVRNRRKTSIASCRRRSSSKDQGHIAFCKASSMLVLDRNRMKVQQVHHSLVRNQRHMQERHS